MAERQLTKPEIASQRRVIKLPPAIGDWTTYRPPKVLVKKVKSGLYGFDRLSKEELNEALLAHYRFVQNLLRRLKIDLNLAVEFLSCQVEQTTYLNFLRTLGGPVAQNKLTLPNVHETIQLFLDLNLANSVINHALGCHNLEPLNRTLTEAEAATFSVALTEYLPYFAAAFNNIFATPAFDYVGSPDLTLDSSINPSSTFVSFSADIALNDAPGKIVFGYPGGSLKTLLKDHEAKSRMQAINFGRLPLATLNKILISVSATLGKTSLSTTELNQLEIGDVVSLDASINAPALLRIGRELSFKVQPGINEKKRSVRLIGFGEEEEAVIMPPTTLEETAPAGTVEPGLPVEMQPESLPEETGFESPFADSAEELAEAEEFPEEDLTDEELEEEDFSEEFPEEEENKGG